MDKNNETQIGICKKSKDFKVSHDIIKISEFLDVLYAFERGLLVNNFTDTLKDSSHKMMVVRLSESLDLLLAS